MIAAKNQGKGYGKKAMLKALSIIRTRPHGKANAVVLSLDPDNEIAKSLYESLGFYATGEMNDDEIIIKLKL